MSPPDPATNDERKEEMRRNWAERAVVWRTMTGARGGMWQATTDLMIDALAVRPGMRVLDVASGPGEPALSIAAAIAPDGQVTATDLTPEMLASAEENARARGVANIAFQQADAESLPFPDGAFDAVTCRFGAMLFPDIQKALGEMRRVLVSDGRVVCLIWGPPERNAQMRPLAIVRRYVDLPVPAPGEPHRFRFSAPGELAEHLRVAGFQQVTDVTNDIAMQWHGTAEEQWEAMLKNNRRMAVAVAALAPTQHAELTQEVLDAIRAEERHEGGGTAAVILVTGRR